MSNDVTFAEGFYPKPKHEKAPDFVIGKLNVKAADAVAWLNAWIAANPGEEWLALDMKVSKQGKGYAVIDDWKPNNQSVAAQTTNRSQPSDFEDSDIPFN
jgi:hypothetical protein